MSEPNKSKETIEDALTPEQLGQMQSFDELVANIRKTFLEAVTTTTPNHIYDLLRNDKVYMNKVKTLIVGLIGNSARLYPLKKESEPHVIMEATYYGSYTQYEIFSNEANTSADPTELFNVKIENSGFSVRSIDGITHFVVSKLLHGLNLMDIIKAEEVKSPYVQDI